MALEYVTELDNLVEAKPAVFEVKGQSIGLIRTSDKIYAVRNLCPHKRAPVCKGTMRGTMLPSESGSFVFGMENQVLQCPRHGWEFDLETGQTLCPSKSRLKLFPVTMQGQSVYLEL
ncbi:Rieske (2Fe-2S) protein [Rhodopila sp.]|jgi:nitrite reductase/ring-hydroxylating ferredoxin subunit|uniref:Rieske (2Fe-2S) protein n=1 Tax=Rhodopila sp. TaxID=2480087 RepID=UPI002C879DD2|nr:Rieske 2Fe-2S domain-containing protein [Rhodopila sp.]HVZ06715.1 Rieske 2Fe-2S domain-containing protein [Rhodopila sp.]